MARACRVLAGAILAFDLSGCAGTARTSVAVTVAATPSPSAAAFLPTGPPMALDLPKFVGSVSSPSQDVNFAAYFNQVTPENGGKWGVVEGTRDVMNWAALDTAYALAKENRLKAPGDARDGTPYPLPFRLHTLVYGSQQPAWVEAMRPDEQRVEIEQWFAAVAARYAGIDFIDVVNEPLHTPPAGTGHGNYIAALGGPGATGWDWVVTAFEMARRSFPGARLGVNEYGVLGDAAAARDYRALVDLLQRHGLVDYVGIQGHAFETQGTNATLRANLDLLAGAGVPLYVTEFDVDGPTDEAQLAEYERLFPLLWEHPAVRGVTLWGYRPGLWRDAQRAYIVLANGVERPAIAWLQAYVRGSRAARTSAAGSGGASPPHISLADSDVQRADQSSLRAPTESPVRAPRRGGPGPAAW